MRRIVGFDARPESPQADPEVDTRGPSPGPSSPPAAKAPEPAEVERPPANTGSGASPVVGAPGPARPRPLRDMVSSLVQSGSGLGGGLKADDIVAILCSEGLTADQDGVPARIAELNAMGVGALRELRTRLAAEMEERLNELPAVVLPADGPASFTALRAGTVTHADSHRLAVSYLSDAASAPGTMVYDVTGMVLSAQTLVGNDVAEGQVLATLLRSVYPLSRPLTDANDPDVLDMDTNKLGFTSNVRLFRPLFHVNEFPKVVTPKQVRTDVEMFLTAWTNARNYHRTTAEKLQKIHASGRLDPAKAGTGIARSSPELQREVQGKVYVTWRPEVYGNGGDVVIPIFLYRHAKLLVDHETVTGRATEYSQYVENESIPVAGPAPDPAGQEPCGYAVIAQTGPDPVLDDLSGLLANNGNNPVLSSVLAVVRSHYGGHKPSIDELRTLFLEAAVQHNLFDRSPALLQNFRP